jgi:hypothetical protein
VPALFPLFTGVRGIRILGSTHSLGPAPMSVRNSDRLPSGIALSHGFSWAIGPGQGACRANVTSPPAFSEAGTKIPSVHPKELPRNAFRNA